MTISEFQTFTISKAQSLDEAQTLIGPIETAADFESHVKNPKWVSDMLWLRRKPLLVLPDNRYMVLDMQFLFENASAGLFWNFMDKFRSAKARHSFSASWGRVFEKYVQQLMEHYFAATRRNVTFEAGDIDILLPSASIVLALEVKSGFIAQDVKGARDQHLLATELAKKYVVDDDGRPKGVRQLANSARALRERAVPGFKGSFDRIYPILVVEDPVMQTAAMNAYLNELFEREIDRGNDVAPVTVLLVDELEEILPHVHAADLSWRELLDYRFLYGKVVAPPMHTSFVQLVAERNLRERPETFLKRHGGELIGMINAAYEPLFGV